MRYRHPRPNCRTHPERFIWPKVDQSGGDDGCWLWQGCLSTNGYGRVGKRDYVHRVVAELHHGPCPDGQEVRHLCGQRRCVNPAHLAYGTRSENMRDAIGHGTHYTPFSAKERARLQRKAAES